MGIRQECVSIICVIQVAKALLKVVLVAFVYKHCSRNILAVSANSCPNINSCSLAMAVCTKSPAIG